MALGEGIGQIVKISSITISNHSRLPDCTLDVRNNLILVGPNGSGKSSLIRCLDMLLGKSIQQLYYSISNSDFRNAELPLLIEAQLTNLTNDELSFFPDEIDIEDESVTIRLEANLDSEDLTITRFFPFEAGNTSLSSAQLKSIKWNMISSDFSTKSLASGRRNIVDDYLKEIDASGDQAELEKAINALSEAINGSSAFSGALDSLASELNPALEGGVTTNNLRFIPGAAIDGNLLSDVRLEMEDKSGSMREVTEQSDGTKALISFTIFGLINSNGIIAIDEPETHLHPSAQRNLMQVLKSSGRQLVIATHSGIVASEFSPDSIVAMRESMPPAQPKSGFLKGQKDQGTLARWWIGSRIELLTARHIIAVEGQSDRMVVERAAELLGYRLKRDGIEVLEAGSCNEMPHVMSIFGADGFGKQVSILIDEDAEDKTARALGIASKDLASKSVFVSRADLEDEYVAAIGSSSLWEAFGKSSLFTPNMLSSIASGTNVPSKTELAAFCRKKKNKIACAVVACSLMDRTSALKLFSVVGVLNNAI